MTELQQNQSTLDVPYHKHTGLDSPQILADDILGLLDTTGRGITATAGEAISKGDLCYIEGVIAATANASQDCYVSSASTGTNYDTTELKVGKATDFISFIKFDISSLPTTAIKAVLKLYTSDSAANMESIRCYRVSETWGETDPTYTDYPTVETGTEIDRGQILNFGSSGQCFELDITTLYNQWQAGTYSNYGLALQTDLSNTNFDSQVATFHSRTGTAGLTPLLTVIGVSSNAGKVYKASSSTLYKTTSRLCIAKATVGSGSTGTFYLFGNIKDLSGFTAGRTHFVSTSGGVSISPGTYPRKITQSGGALSSTQIIFDPQPMILHLNGYEMWAVKNNHAAGAIQKKQFFYTGLRPSKIELYYIETGVSPDIVVRMTITEQGSATQVIRTDNKDTTLTVNQSGSDAYLFTYTFFDYGVLLSYDDTDGASVYTYKFTNIKLIAYQ